jgi:hypothetical protein
MPVYDLLLLSSERISKTGTGNKTKFLISSSLEIFLLRFILRHIFFDHNTGAFNIDFYLMAIKTCRYSMLLFFSQEAQEKRELPFQKIFKGKLHVCFATIKLLISHIFISVNNFPGYIIKGDCSSRRNETKSIIEDIKSKLMCGCIE